MGPPVPPPAPQSGASRSKLALFLVLGLVVVAGVVVALVLALGGDDDDKASDDNGGGGDDAEAVAAVVETWTTAAKEGDCDAAIAVMTEALVEEAGECDPEALGDAEEYGFEIGEPEIDGDSAVVTVTASFQDEEQPIEFRLTREDDEWLISGYGGLGEGAETPSAPESSTSP